MGELCDVHVRNAAGESTATVCMTRAEVAALLSVPAGRVAG